jgi:hypothetical protein
MNPLVELNLTLILFLPWFAILGTLYWLFPRRPRHAARVAFDIVALPYVGAPPGLLEVVFELYPIWAKVVHGLQTVINLGRRVNKPIFFGMGYDIFK